MLINQERLNGEKDVTTDAQPRTGNDPKRNEHGGKRCRLEAVYKNKKNKRGWGGERPKGTRKGDA